jgi:hypothetical protein
MKPALAVLSAAVLVTGCATPMRRGPEPGFVETAQAVETANAPGQCFQLSQINGRRVADADTLYVRVGRRETYRVDMSDPCLSGVTSRDPLLPVSLSGSDQVCGAAQIDLKVRKASGQIVQCAIKDFTLLSARQVSALPRTQRP